MKHIRDDIDRLFDIYRQEALMRILLPEALYILSVREENNQEIIKRTNQISRQESNIISKAAEQLIEKGRLGRR